MILSPPDSILHTVCAGIWLNHDPEVCWVASYFAYYDASGHEEELDRPLVVMGLLSSEAKWLRLEGEWRAHLGAFGLPYLHMQEFAGGRPPFDKIKADRIAEREFLAGCLRLTKRNVNKSVARRMVPAEFWAVNREFQLVEGVGGPYGVLAKLCIAGGPCA